MKNRKRLVSVLAGVMAAIMLLTLLFSILPLRASAASSSEIRKQINSLQDDRKDIKNQITELQAQYQQIGTTLKRLNYKISRYERAVKTGVLSWEADEPKEENCHVLGND